MHVQRLTVPVTTAGDGSATEYSDDFTGRIAGIIYTKTDFTNGVDFSITLERSAESLLVKADVNASTTVVPMQLAHTAAGAGITYDGTRPIYAPIHAADDRVKIVIASGGAAKTGSFDIIVA